MIPQFFHKYSTYEKFNQNLIGGLIHKDSICFIEDTRQIYAQGALYAVSANDFKETNRILQLHQKILDEILGKDGTESEQTTFIDNIKEINNFLGGYDKNTTLMEVFDGMKKAIRLEINEVQKDTQDKILDFAVKIDEFTNEVADKISEYDKNIEKIDGLYQSMKTQYTELSVRFTDLQEELLDYKGKVDLLRTQHETFESDTNENFRLQGLRINAVETAINAVDTRFQQVTDKYAEVLSKLNEVEAAGIETRQKINALELSKGMAGGLATLDNSGHVPSVQLPSYVDDILEFSSMEFFPTVGESGKLYLDKMTNKQYRWSGTQYTEIPKTIALGETSSTAYAGDKGKKVTDDLIAHKNDTDNPHNVSKYQIGLSNVDNTSDLTKPISLAVQALFDSLDAELEEKFNDINDDIDDVDSKIDTHISNNSNPHSVTKSQVGLGNVDNTSDINKPISTATQNALNNKVDKITGKGLSTNDFTTSLKSKLELLPSYTTLNNKFNNKVDKVEGKELSSNDFTEELKNKLINLSNNQILSELDLSAENKITLTESKIYTISNIKNVLLRENPLCNLIYYVYGSSIINNNDFIFKANFNNVDYELNNHVGYVNIEISTFNENILDGNNKLHIFYNNNEEITIKQNAPDTKFGCRLRFLLVHNGILLSVDNLFNAFVSSDNQHIPYPF